MDDEILCQLVLKHEEDEVEFIRLHQCLNSTPCRASVICGRMWVTELLEGHLQRICDNLGIRKGHFKDLCNEIVLRDLWEDKPQ